MQMLHTALLVVAITIYTTLAADWSYEGDDGPEHWADMYETCSGEFQSPVDIQLNSTVENTSLGSLTFTGYDTDNHLSSLNITNNGHTLQINSLNRTAELTGGGLPSSYVFQQIHLHWGGPNNAPGSEHTVDGMRYPAEIHFVHYKSDYLDVDGDLNYTLSGANNDVAAVIGVFIEIGNETHEVFQMIVDTIDEITFPTSSRSTAMPKLNVLNLLPESKKKFLRYQGGLTTPACDELVIWTVMNSTISVTQEQLQALVDGLYHQELGEDNESEIRLQNNYRPVQDLKNRKVTATWDASTVQEHDDGSWGSAGVNRYSHCIMLAAMLATVRLHH